ncbi:MAG: chemotaxis protein CheA [Oscillospiraceae bacterium]
MGNLDIKEPLMDMFIFETNTLLEQLDEILIQSEKSKSFSSDDISEIFRIMHTIKGSAAMMSFDTISTVAHKIEDLFFVIREDHSKASGNDLIFDLVFKGSDFIKMQVEQIQNENQPDGNSTELVAELIKCHDDLLGIPKNEPIKTPTSSQESPVTQNDNTNSNESLSSVRVFFEDGCQMENLRAFMLVTAVKEYCEELKYFPEDIETNPSTAPFIIENGFVMNFKSFTTPEVVFSVIQSALNVKNFEVIQSEVLVAPAAKSKAVKVAASIDNSNETQKTDDSAEKKSAAEQANQTINQLKNNTVKQNLINVNLSKLDKLMEVMGEVVITESMVSASPDLSGLHLDNFNKSARQLRKLTEELQDIVMSLRMVPVSGVFNKMHRLVRDMSKSLDKDVELVIEGGDTEVDKTIIDSLSDPLMHLVRNSMDHGFETIEERQSLGKPTTGTLLLSARNSGGEVIITIEDDGQGMNPEKLMAKAKASGILTKDEKDYTEREILNFVMMAGFSTNEKVTEYSGRGVGMDVVKKNIEKVGGIINIASAVGEGTSFTIKIPLTLAIVDGMEIAVGNATYTLPINSLRESFKADKGQVLYDTNGTELIMIRGECYPIIRLQKIYGINDAITELDEGILILVEADKKSACLFTDRLIGEQKVVVKPLPNYFSKYNLKDQGISGCTILGDGSISLILDVPNILSSF